MKITRRQIKNILLKEFEVLDPQRLRRFNFDLGEEEKPRKAIHLYATRVDMLNSETNVFDITSSKRNRTGVQSGTSYVPNMIYCVDKEHIDDLTSCQWSYELIQIEWEYKNKGARIIMPVVPGSDAEKEIITNRFCADSETDVVIHYYVSDIQTSIIKSPAGFITTSEDVPFIFYYSRNETDAHTINCS